VIVESAEILRNYRPVPESASLLDDSFWQVVLDNVTHNLIIFRVCNSSGSGIPVTAR
jgi:hypothetical protein